MAGGNVAVRLRRAWRGLRSKGAGVQLVALIGALALVAVLVAAVVLLLPSGGSSGGTKHTLVLPSEAEASTDGITDDTVTIVTPIIDLNAAGAAIGLQGGTDEKDEDGIEAFVREINDNGGINGRELVAKVEKFNPLDPADMRAKCKDWTSSGDVFAVVDTGKWYDDQQLCVTEEGETPLISDWTTVTDWTVRGSPYLWWTGPDQSDILRNLVPWGQQQGLLGPETKVGIIVGDRAGDDLALHDYLLPALEDAGIEPVATETITAVLDDPATAESQAKVAVQRLQEKGAETVIPLLPVNSFYAYLAAAKDQEFAPKLALSDYESSVFVAIGLAEFQFPDLVSDQLGLTTYTLGDEDNDLGDTGYEPGALSCFESWKAQGNPVPPYLEAQGPIIRWCQALRLFAQAARDAGPDLNRRSFVEAMSELTDFQGVLTPTLSYAPDDFSGPTQYRTVRVHRNDPNDNQCPLKPDDTVHGSCWIIVEDFQPIAAHRQ